MFYKGIVPNKLIYPLMMKWFLEMESLGIPFDDWICLERWIEEMQMIHWKLSMKCTVWVLVCLNPIRYDSYCSPSLCSTRRLVSKKKQHRMRCGNRNNACEYMYENVLMCRSSMTYWKRMPQHGRQWFHIRLFFMVKPNHVTYICWTIVASCSFWFGRARSPLHIYRYASEVGTFSRARLFGRLVILLNSIHWSQMFMYMVHCTRWLLDAWKHKSW